MMRYRNMLVAVLSLLLFAGLVAAQAGDRDSIRRGNERYLKAEYDAAIAEYSRVTPAAGEVYAQALYNIGVCYYEIWRTEDAIALYRKALAASGGNYPKASYAMGVALEDLKRFPEAWQAYQQTIDESGGKHAEAYFRLGVLSINKSSDPKEALAFFRQAISHSAGRFPNGHNNLGVALARTGHLTEAKREFEIALTQSEGTLAEAKYNLELCRSLLAQSRAQLDSSQLIDKPAFNAVVRP